MIIFSDIEDDCVSCCSEYGESGQFHVSEVWEQAEFVIVNMACGVKKVWSWNSRIIIFHIIKTINFEIYRNPIFIWPMIQCWIADDSSEPGRLCCPDRFPLIPYYFHSYICQEIAQIPLGVLLKLEIRNKKLKKG